MSNSVLTVSNETIAQMMKSYQSSLTDHCPPGAVFVAKPSGCTITAYKSGKVLFQGKSALTEANKWGDTSASGTLVKKNKQKSTITNKYSPPPNISELSIIGSDEVGTGDYFGPMTVVAAYVSSEQINMLKQLGVKDSKDLNDIQITKIAKEIIKLVPHSLLILRNEKYNKLEQSGMNQGKMKALLHNQAINHLLDKLTPAQILDGILIDQFCQPDIFFRYLNGKQIKWKEKNAFFSTKAEGVHIAVAAASIISRYAFVKEFEKLSEQAGFQLPKGAGPQVDKKAAELIKKHGPDSLLKFTKLHFANTDKAKKLL
ncbi:ribonuclease HIII [Bacillus sp. Marseille-P3661]|uniref:ribonuclease HIII n=1 Tax=Bacillus sp. Marseille-P3661 TaxID=1936234 RepID=UPI000C8150C3|nr:ribonuclease HIII [Bacillus sp. Marseille-P3661]